MDDDTMILDKVSTELFIPVWSRIPLGDSPALVVTVMCGDWQGAEPFTVFTIGN